MVGKRCGGYWISSQTFPVFPSISLVLINALRPQNGADFDPPVGIGCVIGALKLQDFHLQCLTIMRRKPFGDEPGFLQAGGNFSVEYRGNVLFGADAESSEIVFSFPFGNEIA